MAGASGDEAVGGRVREAFEAAAATLAEAAARSEAVAAFEQPRPVLGIPRRPRMRPLGRVWRLGVLLVATDGAVFATGRVTRSADPGHRGHVAASAEARREVRAAVYRGPFAAGESVNFDVAPIDLEPSALRSATGPLFLAGDRPLVRWSVSAGDDAARDLQPYLDERVELLLHPPEGAT